MRSRIIVDAGHLPLAGELSTDEADDSGFLSTQRVCMEHRGSSSVGMTVICLHIMVIVLKDSWRLEADLMHVGTAMSMEFDKNTSRLLLL